MKSFDWRIPVAIVLWYLFSIALSSYNKFLFSGSSSAGEGKSYNSTTPEPFPRHPLAKLPLLTTAWHTLIHFLLCLIIMGFILLRTFVLRRRGYRHLDHSDSLAASRQRTPTSDSVLPVQQTPPVSESVLQLFRSWLQLPDRRTYLFFVIPCAMSTALDVGLSNVSLRYITLSLYTMIKSITPVFVLLAALLLKLEVFRWQLIAIICVMSIGVGLMVAEGDATTTKQPSAGFHSFLLGLIAVILATSMSGVRWAFTQFITQSHTAASGLETPSDSDPIELSTLTVKAFPTSSPAYRSTARHAVTTVRSRSSSPRNRSSQPPVLKSEERIPSTTSLTALSASPFLESDSGSDEEVLHTVEDAPTTSPKRARVHHHGNPIRTMFLLSPIMSVSLFIVSFLIEHPWKVYASAPHSPEATRLLIVEVSMGSMVAFFMVLSEYALIGLTSAVTLSVAGMGKEIITLLVASLIFGDRLHPMNWAGLIVTLCTIGYYNYYKYSSQAPHE